MLSLKILIIFVSMAILKKILGVTFIVFGSIVMLFCLINLLKVILAFLSAKEAYDYGRSIGGLIGFGVIGFGLYWLIKYGIKLTKSKKQNTSFSEQDSE